MALAFKKQKHLSPYPQKSASSPEGNALSLVNFILPQMFFKQHRYHRSSQIFKMALAFKKKAFERGVLTSPLSPKTRKPISAKIRLIRMGQCPIPG
jgi:hypothetical protein